MNQYNEIFRLKQMLIDNGIIHNFNEISYPGFTCTYHISINKPNSVELFASVVEGPYTFGGKLDLLEIMGCLTSEEEEAGDVIVGWLSAEEVCARIKTALQLTEGRNEEN